LASLKQDKEFTRLSFRASTIICPPQGYEYFRDEDEEIHGRGDEKDQNAEESHESFAKVNKNRDVQDNSRSRL